MTAEAKNQKILNSLIQEVEPKKETKKDKKATQEEKIINTLKAEKSKIDDTLSKSNSKTAEIEK